MPTQKTFKYQGEERVMMVRDDEDAKITLKEAQSQFRKGNLKESARLLAIWKYLARRNVKFDLVALETPTMSFREMELKTCSSIEIKVDSDQLFVLFLKFSSEQDWDNDSKTIYNIGFSHTKDVFSFLETFE